MAKPRPAAARPTNSRESDESLRARGFNPFLRPEHTKDGDEFTLTGFNYRHRDGNQICVTVMKPDTGDEFTLGIREGSPDHNHFYKAFGASFTDWHPGTVTVAISQGRTPGTAFVNVKAVTAR